jgi:DNA-binding response OmpR family regulator
MTTEANHHIKSWEGTASSSDAGRFTAQENMRQSLLQTGASVWILDDDPLYLKLLQTKLAHSGFDVLGFSHTEDMLQDLKATEAYPDIFVVDLHLGTSKFNGLSICRTIVTLYERPVIILTGDQSTEKTIACLNAGADDYVLKSCQFEELQARLLARLRKVAKTKSLLNEDTFSGEPSPSLLRLGSLVLDLQRATMQCRRNRKTEVQMSHTECKVLGLLMSAPDQTLQRSDAYFALFHREIPPDNRSIDITISRIRRRFQSLGSHYSIRSLRGRGYKLLITPHK